MGPRYRDRRGSLNPGTASSPLLHGGISPHAWDCCEAPNGGRRATLTNVQRIGRKIPHPGKEGSRTGTADRYIRRSSQTRGGTTVDTAPRNRAVPGRTRFWLDAPPRLRLLGIADSSRRSLFGRFQRVDLQQIRIIGAGHVAVTRRPSARLRFHRGPDLVRHSVDFGRIQHAPLL